MRRWLGAWGPAAIWAAVLFLLSSRDTLPVNLASGWDKVAHFTAYLVMGFLLASGASRLRLPLLVAVAIGWFYGATDELHQSMVPGRFASFGDWVADATGTIVGVLIFLLVARRQSASERPFAGLSADSKKT